MAGTNELLAMSCVQMMKGLLFLHFIVDCVNWAVIIPLVAGERSLWRYGMEIDSKTTLTNKELLQPETLAQ